MFEQFIQYLIYIVLGLLGFIMRAQHNRVENIRRDIEQLKVELAKQDQQNMELYSNVRRIDSNIDKLFDRIDQVLEILRVDKSCDDS